MNKEEEKYFKEIKRQLAMSKIEQKNKEMLEITKEIITKLNCVENYEEVAIENSKNGDSGETVLDHNVYLFDEWYHNENLCESDDCSARKFEEENNEN